MISFDDIQNIVGQKVQVLRVGEVSSPLPQGYTYRIYPVELTIQEVRLGEARREAEKDFYGPGFVTLLCQHEKGYVQAFSPIGDEILSNSLVAGRNTRAFFDKSELYQEAQILKECILKNYKHVYSVEICLPEQATGLEERIQDACVRSMEVAPSDGNKEKEMCL